MRLGTTLMSTPETPDLAGSPISVCATSNISRWRLMSDHCCCAAGAVRWHAQQEDVILLEELQAFARRLLILVLTIQELAAGVVHAT